MGVLSGLILLVATATFGWYIVRPVLVGSAKVGCALAMGIVGLFVLVIIILISTGL